MDVINANFKNRRVTRTILEHRYFKTPLFLATYI